MMPSGFLLASSCACRSTKAHSRSEEHTSELQSRPHLVCRLLLEKKQAQHHVLGFAQIRARLLLERGATLERLGDDHRLQRPHERRLAQGFAIDSDQAYHTALADH